MTQWYETLFANFGRTYDKECYTQGTVGEVDFEVAWEGVFAGQVEEVETKQHTAPIARESIFIRCTVEAKQRDPIGSFLD